MWQTFNKHFVVMKFSIENFVISPAARQEQPFIRFIELH